MAGPPTSPVNLSSASDTETSAANAAAAADDDDDDDDDAGEACCCYSCNERRSVFSFHFCDSFTLQRYVLPGLI